MFPKPLAASIQDGIMLFLQIGLRIIIMPVTKLTCVIMQSHTAV